MAKTNWVLNDIVMPADMNQIGTEINAKAEKHDTLLTGVTSLERRNLIRISENKRTLGNSPNQKLNLTLPALVASGVLRVSVYGAYNINDDNGIISKDFSFVSNASNIISINQEYSEILGNARNSFRISDIDVANRIIRIAYTPNVSVGQGVNIKIEMFVSSRDESAIVTSNQFFRNITIGEFYQDSFVLPTPVVQKRQLELTAPQGTSPLVVTSNTKIDNINSDLVDGFHASQNKDVNTVAVRRADGSVQLGGFSEFEQIGIKLPGRNRELRITQDANNITYIQLVDQNGGFIANPIQINSDGTAGLNVSTNVISYSNPATPQVRNTHVGNTAPSNSLGINGDMYIEV